MLKTTDFLLEIQCRTDVNIQLTIQGKERALMLSVDMHTFDKILPSIGMLL